MLFIVFIALVPNHLSVDTYFYSNEEFEGQFLDSIDKSFLLLSAAIHKIKSLNKNSRSISKIKNLTKFKFSNRHDRVENSRPLLCEEISLKTAVSNMSYAYPMGT